MADGGRCNARTRECCPPSGTLIARGTTSELAVAMTVEGRVVLGSREEVAHMLDPVGGLAATAMAYAIPLVREEFAARVAAGGRREVVAESLDLFRAVVHARSDPDALQAVESAAGVRTDPELTVDEAARLIASLDHWGARDEVMTWYDGERGDATRSLLLELARRSVLPGEAAALTVLAWVCYLRGEGVMAGIAIDRARDRRSRVHPGRVARPDSVRRGQPVDVPGNHRERRFSAAVWRLGGDDCLWGVSAGLEIAAERPLRSVAFQRVRPPRPRVRAGT